MRSVQLFSIPFKCCIDAVAYKYVQVVLDKNGKIRFLVLIRQEIGVHSVNFVKKSKYLLTKKVGFILMIKRDADVAQWQSN